MKNAVIINNMASRCPLDVFRMTFDSINDYSHPIYIVDDSGLEKIPYGYYDFLRWQPGDDGYDLHIRSQSTLIFPDRNKFTNVTLIANNSNENLLTSRFTALEYIKHDLGEDVLIRYIDAGDKAINSSNYFHLVDNVDEDEFDWYSFPQTGFDGTIVSDNIYYSAVGCTKDKTKVQLGILTTAMCSPLWSKIFKLSGLIKVRDRINSFVHEFYEDRPIQLFDMEDYLISGLYSLDAVTMSGDVIPYISYDYGSGDSHGVKTYDQLRKIQSNLNKVIDMLLFYFDANSDIRTDIVKYLIERRAETYYARFTDEPFIRHSNM